MATCYVVSYIPKPENDYSDLTRELERCLSYWPGLKPTWLVLSLETVTQLYGRLAPHLDETDTLLISKVGSPYAGQLPPAAWDWLQKHVDN